MVTKKKVKKKAKKKATKVVAEKVVLVPEDLMGRIVDAADKRGISVEALLRTKLRTIL